MLFKKLYEISYTGVISTICLTILLAATGAAFGASSNILPVIYKLLLMNSETPNLPPPDGDHSSITSWSGTATCLQCHEVEGQQVFNSVHYQWLGETPYMTDGPASQGKLDVGVNSYCINTTGNWNGCGSCHTGLGARPEPAVSQSQLENIDCLICHQDEYKRIKVDGTFVPDTVNMSISIVEAARTVHLPTRTSCLQCHANGGGGDNFKRGDMARAHASTTDRDFDVHMATTGADLSCQECHTTQDHLMAGRGSDLRPTDLDLAMSCTDCHTDKDSATGHTTDEINRHVARVACQSCHIESYARDAVDTLLATEETEVHRDWLDPHVTASGAIHPRPTMAGNLVPRYKWWNGSSSSYLLFDQAVIDPLTGRIPTSRPEGAIDDQPSKLYPFKYKTALQPLASNPNELIALDTSVYFTTGLADAATVAGLENMGYSAGEAYEWIETDTYQLITHEVTPASAALACASCHESTQRMDLQGELGYQLKDTEAVVCIQCHDDKGSQSFDWIHAKHVNNERYDCSSCHTFSRPERNLSS